MMHLFLTILKILAAGIGIGLIILITIAFYEKLSSKEISRLLKNSTGIFIILFVLSCVIHWGILLAQSWERGLQYNTFLDTCVSLLAFVIPFSLFYCWKEVLTLEGRKDLCIWYIILLLDIIGCYSEFFFEFFTKRL